MLLRIANDADIFIHATPTRDIEMLQNFTESETKKCENLILRTYVLMKVTHLHFAHD